MLDAGRIVQRDSFSLKGHLKGDRVCAEDVRVHAGELEADTNFVPATLLRASERSRSVRLEFAGGHRRPNRPRATRPAAG